MRLIILLAFIALAQACVIKNTILLDPYKNHTITTQNSNCILSYVKCVGSCDGKVVATSLNDSSKEVMPYRSDSFGRMYGGKISSVFKSKFNISIVNGDESCIYEYVISTCVYKKKGSGDLDWSVPGIILACILVPIVTVLILAAPK